MPGLFSSTNSNLTVRVSPKFKTPLFVISYIITLLINLLTLGMASIFLYKAMLLLSGIISAVLSPSVTEDISGSAAAVEAIVLQGEATLEFSKDSLSITTNNLILIAAILIIAAIALLVLLVKNNSTTIKGE